MMKYDYLGVLKKDIYKALKDDYYCDMLGDSASESFEKLYDEFWLDDGVTGNASGSYFCNAWKAEEAICHNLDLYLMACEELGIDQVQNLHSAELMDVTIRCFLLGEALSEVLKEYFNEE